VHYEDKNNENVYAYTPDLTGRKLLILLNFKGQPAKANLGIDLN
jgi:oligo-1,6-glucosidase